MWRLICWFSLGIPFFLMGLAIRRGKGRINRWYLHTQLIPYMPPSTAYGYIPLSFGFFLPPIILALPISGEVKINLIFVAWGICFLLMMVFPIRKPRFLKPAWLQRLETQYPPDAIEMFKQEWKKMDRDEWARKIGTEEGMKELMKLATDKYGEYDPVQKAFVKVEPIPPGEHQ
jgi:hypothetical protein